MRLAAVIVGWALAVASAGPAALAQTPPDAEPSFDSAGWVADWEQVRQAMSSHYANLEWAATEREAPLGALFDLGVHPQSATMRPVRFRVQEGAQSGMVAVPG